jgi:hypothetical protein
MDLRVCVMKIRILNATSISSGTAAMPIIIHGENNLRRRHEIAMMAS